MEHLDVVADDARFADDGSGAVIDEEMGTDASPGVEVHPGSAVGPFAHDSRDEGDLPLEQLMSQALDGDGFDEGVGDDDFFLAERGGIAVERGLDIGLEDFTNARQLG